MRKLSIVRFEARDLCEIVKELANKIGLNWWHLKHQKGGYANEKKAVMDRLVSYVSYF